MGQAVRRLDGSAAFAFLVAVLALGLLLSAGGPSPNTYAHTEKGGEVKEFVLIAQEWGFNQSKGAPAIVVDQGDTVRITVINRGQVPHDLALDVFNVATSLLSLGERETVEFVADAAGTFVYFCSVPGHKELGMQGELIVRGEGERHEEAPQAEEAHEEHEHAQASPVEAVLGEEVVEGVKFTFSTVPSTPLAGSPTHFHVTVASAVDGYATPVQHIDVVMTITLQERQVLKAFLHSHPGFFELNHIFSEPGQYTARIEVSTTPDTVKFQGEEYAFGSRTAEFTFNVAGLGPNTVVLEEVTVEFQIEPATPMVGEPTTLSFTTRSTETGEPISHIDTLLRIVKEGVTIYETAQAHTHTGVQKLVYSFPEPGTYLVETEFRSIEPSSIHFGKRAATFTVNVKSPTPLEEQVRTALILAESADENVRVFETKIEATQKSTEAAQRSVEALRGEIQSLKQKLEQQSPAGMGPLALGSVAVALIAIALSGFAVVKSGRKP